MPTGKTVTIGEKIKWMILAKNIMALENNSLLNKAPK